ncbi:CgeB family protein [Coraliomargarita sp. W4R72]
MISYSPDDMMNPYNQSRAYLGAVPEYDLHVTTKSYNVKELRLLGAREVYFQGNAYDPTIHSYRDLSERDYFEYKADVSFVGAWEAARVQSMCVLVESGVDVVFRCPVWPVGIRRPKKLCIIEGYLPEDEYAKAICAAKINLGFLRKANRDLQTQRSVEIPACSAFLLAERTAEHLELFQEGVEADFFDTDEELVAKVKYYLAESDLRKKIARAGHSRCISSGYSNMDRLNQVLEQL